MFGQRTMRAERGRFFELHDVEWGDSGEDWVVTTRLSDRRFELLLATERFDRERLECVDVVLPRPSERVAVAGHGGVVRELGFAPDEGALVVELDDPLPRVTLPSEAGSRDAAALNETISRMLDDGHHVYLNGILAGERCWFFPEFRIGGRGLIVPKQFGERIPVSCMLSASAAVWGYDRGLLDSDATLAVTRVRDLCGLLAFCVACDATGSIAHDGGALTMRKRAEGIEALFRDAGASFEWRLAT